METRLQAVATPQRSLLANLQERGVIPKDKSQPSDAKLLDLTSETTSEIINDSVCVGTSDVVDAAEKHSGDQVMLKKDEDEDGLDSQQVQSLGACEWPHRDVGNAGIYYATAVGDSTGGQLCVENCGGDVVHQLDDDLPRAGKAGYKFLCKLHDVRMKIVPFNGKRDLHLTMPWIGDRWAIILFTLGTKSALETPRLSKEVLKKIGRPSGEIYHLSPRHPFLRIHE